MDPRNRADEALARARARRGDVVTPDNATSPADAEATVRLHPPAEPATEPQLPAQSGPAQSGSAQPGREQAPGAQPGSAAGAQLPQQPPPRPPRQAPVQQEQHAAPQEDASGRERHDRAPRS